MRVATEAQVAAAPAAPTLLVGHAVGDAVRALFTPATRDRRRVILVAFVGNHPMSFLDDVQGAEIICWPKGDSTRARGVRELIKSKANVRFADRLHMKVYWVEGARAIIGSANLSKNGLDQGLDEAAVSVPASDVDIDGLLKGIGSREVKEGELKNLERENRRADKARRRLTFQEWLASGNKSSFKLGWFDAEAEEDPPAVKAAVQAIKKGAEASDFLVTRRKDTYAPGDWVLYLHTKEGGRQPRTDCLVEWMLVRDIVTVSRDEAEAWEDARFRHFAYELDAGSAEPPFQLDKTNKSAIRKAYAKLAKSWPGGSFPDEAMLKFPPPSFLEDVRARIKAGK